MTVVTGAVHSFVVVLKGLDTAPCLPEGLADPGKAGGTFSVEQIQCVPQSQAGLGIRGKLATCWDLGAEGLGSNPSRPFSLQHP